MRPFSGASSVTSPASALDALAPVGRLPLEEYRQRFYERKAAERLLQEAIEAALDINTHVIAEHGVEIPEDYYGGFLALGRLHVIPEELARQLAPSAGLRNRLVHEYEALDDAKVLASIETILKLYPEFVSAIESFLIRSGL